MIENIERVNSFRKKLSIHEAHSAKIEYIGTFKSLSNRAEKFFDKYEAGKLVIESGGLIGNRYLEFYRVNPEAYRINKSNHERFNRSKPLQLIYPVRYMCSYEKESKRVDMARADIIRQLHIKYKKEDEFDKLAEGIDYRFIIEKMIL